MEIQTNKGLSYYTRSAFDDSDNKSVTHKVLHKRKLWETQEVSNVLEMGKTIRLPFHEVWQGAANQIPLAKNSLDLILTSPPYWQKRDYGFPEQIGQESTSDEYAESVVSIMDKWKPALKKTGSVFINIGDSIKNGCLMEIPGRVALLACQKGWKLRQRIIWEKPNSTPTRSTGRLNIREEYILHFTPSDRYYSDVFGFKEKFGSISNIWRIYPAQQKGDHLAPFPKELVERILTLACPKQVCVKCGTPYFRQIEKTNELNPNRPQAKRAMEIAELAFSDGRLTKEHIIAIQAVGNSDVGKSMQFQSGSGKNSKHHIKLANEAKEVLGGYFREFTFPTKKTIGWKGCNCGAETKPGLVYDAFLGTGTTLRVAKELGLSAIGSDLKIYNDLLQTLADLKLAKI